MIISVASGKGGTGKTLVATNLAAVLGSKAVLLDCDVEAPNANLFLQPEFEKSITVSTPVPEVDENKCTYCGKCDEICQFKAIIVAAKTVLTFPELCHSCGGCTAVCPENAITEKGRELGIIEFGHRNDLKTVQGKLRVGEAMSPPLINKVREYIHPDRVNIIDAPPGTSCPVIAAMKNTDFVVLVTEPTPFGLYDLQLAVGAVQTLKIPCGIIINRSDLGDRRVRDYVDENAIPVLMEIPFQRKIAETYSRGELMVDKFPGMKSQFITLFKAIEEIIECGKRI